LKALTLTQPWATLMALREKRIETRSWSTSYRGEVIIHAAKGFPRWAKETCEHEPFKSALGELRADTLPLGRGLCVVRLVGCFPTNESGLNQLGFAMGCKPHVRELEFGDYSEGRYAWLTEYVRELHVTFPVKGALGLWEYPRELCV
jgi:hypothetical protein